MRARMEWAEHGDKGSKYFSQLLKYKEARERIEMVVEGRRSTQPLVHCTPFLLAQEPPLSQVHETTRAKLGSPTSSPQSFPAPRLSDGTNY